MRWRAHAGEVLSIEYVSHETQPLVLSASGDCTVRLWTLNGQYIGTFGQVGVSCMRDRWVCHVRGAGGCVMYEGQVGVSCMRGRWVCHV